MSVARSQLISSIRTLCAEPPDLPLPDGLPTALIFEELVNIESSMLRDLNLSSRNARVVKTEIDLSQDQEDFTLSEGDFHSPAYAFLLTDTVSDFWHPVEIVDQSSLGQSAINGQLAISLTGSLGHFSWTPDGSQTLRIWYERGGNDTPTMSESTELGNLYDEYLKLQCAAQCREHFKLELGSMLSARLVKSERQWQRHVNQSHQRGLGQKTPSLYTRGRYARPYLDRTRYFVP